MKPLARRVLTIASLLLLASCEQHAVSPSPPATTVDAGPPPVATSSAAPAPAASAAAEVDAAVERADAEAPASTATLSCNAFMRKLLPRSCQSTADCDVAGARRSCGDDASVECELRHGKKLCRARRSPRCAVPYEVGAETDARLMVNCVP